MYDLVHLEGLAAGWRRQRLQEAERYRLVRQARAHRAAVGAQSEWLPSRRVLRRAVRLVRRWA